MNEEIKTLLSFITVDEKGLVKHVVKEVLIKFLHDKAVATATPVDDMLVEKLEKMVDEYLAK